MRKNLIFSYLLIILLPSIYFPNIYVNAVISKSKPLYLDNKYRGLFTGVSYSGFGDNFNIIVHGNKSFLYLGNGVFYPTDLLPVNSYKAASSGGSVKHLKGNWRKIPLRLILEYSDSKDKNKILNMITKLGGHITYIYHVFPFIAVKIPLENFSKIQVYTSSLKIMVDYRVTVHLNESVPIIKPPDKWSQLEASIGKEINGSGIIIGILDTGIYGRHPDFYFPNGTCKIIYNVSFVPGEDASDRFGHGTHVAGIAAGTGLASHGVFKGVAPGALLANIKVLADNGSGYVSWILEGIEYAVNKSIDIINLSFGGGGNGVGDDPLSIALDIASKKGVVPVVAAGNEGPYYYSLGIPAVSKSAITVGAIEKNLSIADFSSRGPTGDLRIKPDVVAPGVDIIAPLAEGSYIAKLFSSRYPKDIFNGVNGRYVKLSGTSMAAPHVAGVAALILQVHRNYTPEMVKSAIMSTAIDIGLDRFTEGNGLVNAYYAIKTPILIINSSNTFGEEAKPMKSILYKLINKDNVLHTLKIVSVKLSKLYGGETPGFSSLFRITGLPEKIDAGEVVNFTVSLLSLPNPGVYAGSVELQVDNICNLTFTFSLAIVIKVVANITYYGKYIDGYFVMYNKNNPKSFIFPAGYSYNESGGFRYHVWFYLEPGNYSLFVASLNSPNETTHLINGPMYLATKSLSLPSTARNVYLRFRVENSAHHKIPIHDNIGNTIIPYFRILSFKTSSNKTLGIFTGGLWNITTGDIYFSLYSGDTIYINFQFIRVPSFLENNVVNDIEYSTDFYTASWEFVTNPYIFILPPTYNYSVLSNSLVDDDLGKIGFAVFPPGFNLTYVRLLNFFQGGKYYVHTNIPHHKEYIGVLTFGLEGFKYRSLAYLNPTYQTSLQSTEIRAVSPPYVPSTYIVQGFKSGEHYLNISSMLATSLYPFNVIGDGNSTMKIFLNNSLLYQSTEYGDLDYHEKDYIKWVKGRFSVYSSYNLSYPLYQNIYSHVYFDTEKSDHIPPIPYQFYIPTALNENSDIQFIFLENMQINNVSLYYSWNSGETWISSNYTLSSQQRSTLYKQYLINASIPRNNAFLSIKICVWDESGNYVNITMYNVSSPVIGEYSKIPDIYFYPRYVSPGENVSIHVNPNGNNAIYGLPVYIDGYLSFNIPVNASKYVSLENFTSYNSVGEHNLKSYLDYNVLKEPVDLISRLAVTYLYTPYISIDGKVINTTENGIAIYRGDVNKKLSIKIPVKWFHNGSPVVNAYIIINGSTYITDKDGFASFEVSSDKVASVLYKIDKVYYKDHLDNTTFSDSILNVKYIRIVFDSVKIILASNIRNRYPVGHPVYLIIKAVYAYDNKPFDGDLILNKNKVVKGENGVYNITLIQASPGKYTYNITGILDEKYNLTSFTPLSINLIFDKLEAKYNYKVNPVSVDITVKVYFSSDKTPVQNATVYINNVKAREISTGVYESSINAISWSQTISININYNGYKPLNMKFKIENIFIIIYIFILIVVVAAAIIYLKTRKKTL